MCGRFVSSSNPDEIASYFGAVRLSELVLQPSYNVAPTDDVYVVVGDADGARRVDAFHWGLVPMWAKDPKVGSRMINARAETLVDKPAFRDAFRRRRCIIPADGFYEWQKLADSKQKQPYFLHRSDEEPFAFAGVWEQWRGPDGGLLRSCAVITCGANATMAPIHDRMPVILPADAWGQWLDPTDEDTLLLSGLLVPAPPELIMPRPVGSGVNSVRNNDPSLTDRVDPPTSPHLPTQPRLIG